MGGGCRAWAPAGRTRYESGLTRRPLHLAGGDAHSQTEPDALSHLPFWEAFAKIWYDFYFRCLAEFSSGATGQKPTQRVSGMFEM